MMSLKKDVRTCNELLIYHGGSAPLYTIDRGASIVGKEFTYKGRQVIVITSDPRKKTMSLAPLVRGKPDMSNGMVVSRREFEQLIKTHFEDKMDWQKQTDAHLQSVLTKLDRNWKVDRDSKGNLILVHKKGKIVQVPKRANFSDLPKLIGLEEDKKKCTCKNSAYYCDVECPVHGTTALAPFYGKTAQDRAPGEKAPSEITTAPPGGSGTPTTPTMSSCEFTGASIMEDIYSLQNLCEQAYEAMRQLAAKYLDSETRYYVKKENLIRAGYLAGYQVGRMLKIERDVFPTNDEQVGDFMERQINLSVPGQRLQTALKVKDLIFDVLDGTLLVNNSAKNTAEFIKWAKEMIQDYVRF